MYNLDNIFSSNQLLKDSFLNSLIAFVALAITIIVSFLFDFGVIIDYLPITKFLKTDISIIIVKIGFVVLVSFLLSLWMKIRWFRSHTELLKKTQRADAKLQELNSQLDLLGKKFSEDAEL